MNQARTKEKEAFAIGGIVGNLAAAIDALNNASKIATTLGRSDVEKKIWRAHQSVSAILPTLEPRP